MASPVLVQSVKSEMDSLMSDTSFKMSEPLDMSKGLRRSPTIELLNQEKLPRNQTSSLVSLLAMSMKIASLPQVSIGSFFEKKLNAEADEDEVQKPEDGQEEQCHRDGTSDADEWQESYIEDISDDEETENDIKDQTEDQQRNENSDVMNHASKAHNQTGDDVDVAASDEDERVDEEMDGTGEKTNADHEESGKQNQDGTSHNLASSSPLEQMTEENRPDHEDHEEMQVENEAEMSEEDQSIYRGPPPIEVAISFDTTGSMSSLLDPLRADITNVCERLFTDIPNLRIAIIAHGDYCDEEEFYLMKAVDFTQDFGALRAFLNETDGTGGGDFAECYEYVLHRVGQLSWTPGTQRALIMIGDAVPHEVDSPDNKMGLDWRQEVGKLYHQMGICVYSVQCKEEEGAEIFWRELAERASGRYLQLREFDHIVRFIMAICYRERDPMMFGAFEHEVRHNVGAGMAQDLHKMFEALRDGPSATSTSAANVSDDAVPGTSGAPVARPGKRKRKEDAATSNYSSPAKKIRKSPEKGKRSVIAATKIVKKAITSKVHKPAAPLMSASNGRNKTRYLRHQKGRLVKGRTARERVPETRFMLGKEAWSPWKLAVRYQQLDSSWIPCRKGRAGFRNTKLFKNNNRLPALYEFAVQPAASRKRYPVYLRATDGFTNSLRCDTYFLRHSTLMDLVEGAINKNYQVYVRRLIVKKPIRVQVETRNTKTDNVGLLSKMLFKEYDYAWNINTYASSGARPVRF